MSELLSSVAGGGGVFVPSFISMKSTVSTGGGAGSVLLLTPPSGERVQLMYLYRNVAGVESGITLNIGSTTVVSAQPLDDAVGTGAIAAFTVGSRGGNSTTTDQSDSFIAGVDETIEVLAASGLNSNLQYAYRFGVLK